MFHCTAREKCDSMDIKEEIPSMIQGFKQKINRIIEAEKRYWNDFFQRSSSFSIFFLPGFIAIIVLILRQPKP